MNIGERIRELRKKANMTQEAMAERLMLSPQAISRWEKGTAMPDITLLPAISEMFSVTTDYLLGVKDVGREEAIERANKAAHGDCSNLEGNEQIIKECLQRYPDSREIKESYQKILVMKKLVGTATVEDAKMLADLLLELDEGDVKSENIFLDLAKELGLEEQAKEIIRRRSSMSDSYEISLAGFLSGRDAVNAWRLVICQAFDALNLAISYLYRNFSLLTEEEFAALERLAEIPKIIDGRKVGSTIDISSIYHGKIIYYAKSGQYEKMSECADEFLAGLGITSDDSVTSLRVLLYEELDRTLSGEDEKIASLIKSTLSIFILLKDLQDSISEEETTDEIQALFDHLKEIGEKIRAQATTLG